MPSLADEFKQFAPIIGGAVGSIFPGVGTVVGTGAGAIIGGLAGGLISYYSKSNIRSIRSIRSISKVQSYRIPVYRRLVVSRSALISKKTVQKVSPGAVAIGAVAGAVIGNVGARLIEPLTAFGTNVPSKPSPAVPPSTPPAPIPVTVGSMVTDALLNSVPIIPIVRNAPAVIQTVTHIAATPVDSILQAVYNNPAINPIAAYNQVVSGAQQTWNYLSGLFNPPPEPVKPPQDAMIDTWTASMYGE